MHPQTGNLAEQIWIDRNSLPVSMLPIAFRFRNTCLVALSILLRRHRILNHEQIQQQAAFRFRELARFCLIPDMSPTPQYLKEILSELVPGICIIASSRTTRLL